jgi:nicotinate-nucleotide adenylyltransferase
MRIAVYGGSFNPPHIGHLMVTAWLSWSGRCDEVWWIPVVGHPFAKDLAPFEVRRMLCEIATSELPRVRVCAVERELPVPSYTVDTLDHLSARYPHRQFQLVIGADVLGQTDRWKAWDRIQTKYRPIVVGRAGYPPVRDAVTFPEVSSTEVRTRVRAGAPIDHLVPASIAPAICHVYAPPAEPPPAEPVVDPGPRGRDVVAVRSGPRRLAERRDRVRV